MGKGMGGAAYKSSGAVAPLTYKDIAVIPKGMGGAACKSSGAVAPLTYKDIAVILCCSIVNLSTAYNVSTPFPIVPLYTNELKIDDLTAVSGQCKRRHGSFRSLLNSTQQGDVVTRLLEASPRQVSVRCTSSFFCCHPLLVALALAAGLRLLKSQLSLPVRSPVQLPSRLCMRAPSADAWLQSFTKLSLR